MPARPAPIARAVLFSLSLFAPAGLAAVPPRVAPPAYATANYGLTFRAPRGATYCPLPAGWIGSDHGTTLFLERPRRCGASASYPSTGRSFAPASLARIRLYYGYVTWDEGEVRPPPCREIGRIPFLGRARPLCRTDDHGEISVEVAGRYVSDRRMEAERAAPSEAVLTLVTRAGRLTRDLAVFRRVAASLRTCRAIWHGPRGRYTVGIGPLCPDVGTF